MNESQVRRIENLRKSRPSVSFRPEDFTRPVYHYTSPSGLLGMITEGRIRATHHGFVNDSREFDYGLGLLEKIIERVAEANDSRYIRQALALLLISADKPSGEAAFYIACFCQQANVPGMWLSYKSSCCIEFDFVSDYQASPSGWSFQRVEYDEVEQMKKLEAIVGVFIRHLREESEEEDYRDALIELYGEKLMRALISMKHADFKGEQEWRLAFRNPETDMVRPQFESRCGHLRPYLHYPASINCNLTPRMLPITKVIVGPAPDQKLLQASCELMLRSYGYSAKVKPSGTSLRGI